MQPPIGFITLRDAVDVVGRKLKGSGWRPLTEMGAHTITAGLNPEIDQVLNMIAERCETGEISATYRSVTGVDSLDRAVWLMPHWRNYFATGTIDLDLPLIDEHLQPAKSGGTARCTREIYIRRDDLTRAIARSPNSSMRSSAPRANKKKIAAVVTSYRQSLADGANPSMVGLEHFAHKHGVIGHRPDLRAEYQRQFPNQRVGRPRK